MNNDLQTRQIIFVLIIRIGNETTRINFSKMLAILSQNTNWFQVEIRLVSKSIA